MRRQGWLEWPAAGAMQSNALVRVWGQCRGSGCWPRSVASCVGCSQDPCGSLERNGLLKAQAPRWPRSYDLCWLWDGCGSLAGPAFPRWSRSHNLLRPRSGAKGAWPLVAGSLLATRLQPVLVAMVSCGLFVCLLMPGVPGWPHSYNLCWLQNGPWLARHAPGCPCVCCLHP